MERWAAAYEALSQEARDLGIPKSAIPALPNDVSPQQLRTMRDHLQAMMASFMSSGL